MSPFKYISCFKLYRAGFISGTLNCPLRGEGYPSVSFWIETCTLNSIGVYVNGPIYYCLCMYALKKFSKVISGHNVFYL